MQNKQIEQLFSIQRDATVGVIDGVIVFVNPAGQTRYPNVLPGDPAEAILPQEVLEREEETFSVSVTVRAEVCTVLGSRADRMRMYTFLPQAEPDEEAGRLLENVCNSMRRTLTVLNMATELLTPVVDQLHEPRQKSNLTAINKSYYQLQRLCENLDSLVRLSAGQECLRLEHVELVQFCEDLIQSTSHFVERLGHQIHFKSEPRQLIMALDRPKIYKLLLNLISNSLKRLPPGGSLYLDLTGGADDAVLTLRDTGEGIPPGEMAHVFTQWGRVRSDTDPRAGVGAGMAVAEKIARLHGGTLLLTSREGEGASVCLRLPVRRLESDGQLLENPLPYGAGDGGMHMILTELAEVLDDDAFGRKYRD